MAIPEAAGRARINREAVPRDIVVIGASAGGVEALSRLFARLPARLPAALAVVLHMRPTQASSLPAILARAGRLPVVAATDGAAFGPGSVYVAVPDQHLLVQKDRIHLSRDPREHLTRPAIDPLFRSAAAAYGPRVIGVLLSGVGTDGVTGATAIKRAGGLVFVEKPSEARHPTLPLAAIRHDGVDAVLAVDELADVLPKLAVGESVDHVPGLTIARREG